MKLHFKTCQGCDGPSMKFSALVDDNCDWQQLQHAISLSQPQIKIPLLSLNKKVGKHPWFIYHGIHWLQQSSINLQECAIRRTLCMPVLAIRSKALAFAVAM